MKEIKRRMDESAEAFAERCEEMAEEQGRFAAYEKARELVGFSHSACHVIEAQMQQEFPDRTFVPSTQMMRGSAMDGGNMRMPRTPNQFREEGRVEMREKCAQVADPGEWSDWMDMDDEAAAQHKGAMQIMNEIRALPTSSEGQQAEQSSDGSTSCPPPQPLR